MEVNYVKEITTTPSAKSLFTASKNDKEYGKTNPSNFPDIKSIRITLITIENILANSSTSFIQNLGATYLTRRSTSTLTWASFFKFPAQLKKPVANPLSTFIQNQDKFKDKIKNSTKQERCTISLD